MAEGINSGAMTPDIVAVPKKEAFLQADGSPDPRLQQKDEIETMSGRLGVVERAQDEALKVDTLVDFLTKLQDSDSVDVTASMKAGAKTILGLVSTDVPLFIKEATRVRTMVEAIDASKSAVDVMSAPVTSELARRLQLEFAGRMDAIQHASDIPALVAKTVQLTPEQLQKIQETIDASIGFGQGMTPAVAFYSEDRSGVLQVMSSRSDFSTKQATMAVIVSIRAWSDPEKKTSKLVSLGQFHYDHAGQIKVLVKKDGDKNTIVYKPVV